MGDLLQGRVAASVAAVRLGHSHSGPFVRALSRLDSTLARAVKRALSRSFGAVWGAARVLERGRNAQRRQRRRYAKLGPWTRDPCRTDAHDTELRPGAVRGGHRHRGPQPAADLVEDVLWLFDGLRRRSAEHACLPGLPWPTWRAADHQQA